MNLIGWWKIRLVGKEGLAPAVYLRKINNANIKRHSTAADRPPRPETPPQQRSTPHSPPQQRSTPHSPPHPSRAWNVKPLAARYSVKNAQRRGGGQPTPTVTPSRVEYTTIADFHSTMKDCLAFKAGVIIQEVIEQPSSGDWWFVRISGNCGWIPKQFIQRKETMGDGTVTLVQHRAPHQSSLSQQRDSVHYMSTDVVSETATDGSKQKTVETANDKPTNSRVNEVINSFNSPSGARGTVVLSPGGGRVPSPGGGRVPSPGVGRVPSHGGGRVPSPGGGRVPSPGGVRCPSPLVCQGATSGACVPAVMPPSDSIAIAAYQPAAGESGVCLSVGDRVSVIQHSHTGWSWVEVENEQGWVPASYLNTDSAGQCSDRSKPPRPPPPKINK